MKIATINPYQPSSFRLDFLAESVMEGLQKNGVDVISSAPCTGAGTLVENDDEFVERAKEMDYIFVIWDKPKGNKPDPKYYLLDKINMPEKSVFVDGAEWTHTGYMNPKPQQLDEALINPSRRRGEPWIWAEMNDKVKWHFKRECYPQDMIDFGCIPLPFAAVDRYFRNSLERKYTLQCSFGHHSTGIRQEIQNICDGLKINALVGQLPHDQYLKALSESYAVVDAWGGGDCNARFYEAAANGAVLFYQKYQILTPYPYFDGLTAITYATPDEFREKVKYYFHHRLDEIIEMGKRSFEHTLKYHTSEARVKYMLDIITGKLDPKGVVR